MCSHAMQNWVKDLSAYVKSIDPAHLVMVSSWGYFGKSTPDLQPENPYDLTWRGIGNNAGVSSSDSSLASCDNPDSAHT